MSKKSLVNRVLYHTKVPIREKMNKFLAPHRRKKLHIGEGRLTILSNNCWGAHVYRWCGLPYDSPTIGLYIWPSDYLKFLRDLDYYLEQELTFINYRDSKYSDLIIERGETDKPIGLLDDVEIVFLHYSSPEEAREKWERRKARIDREHLLVKCSMQNGMTLEQVKEFDRLPYQHKICFVPKEMPEIKSTVFYKKSKGKSFVDDDVLFFKKYIDLTSMINRCFDQ